jgi:hypothetical protein
MLLMVMSLMLVVLTESLRLNIVVLLLVEVVVTKLMEVS